MEQILTAKLTIRQNGQWACYIAYKKKNRNLLYIFDLIQGERYQNSDDIEFHQHVFDFPSDTSYNLKVQIHTNTK